MGVKECDSLNYFVKIYLYMRIERCYDVITTARGYKMNAVQCMGYSRNFCDIKMDVQSKYSLCVSTATYAKCFASVSYK